MNRGHRGTSRARGRWPIFDRSPHRPWASPAPSPGGPSRLRDPILRRPGFAGRRKRAGLCVAVTLAFLAIVATSAQAYATIEAPPIYSTAPGLPDGRVYEEVSPVNKNGNEAGAGSNELFGGIWHYSIAAADGDSVLFEGTGGMGETAAAYNLFFVASRTTAGWTTRSVMPRAQESPAEFGGTLQAQPQYLDPSADLSHVMFKAAPRFAEDMPDECGTYRGEPILGHAEQLYLSGSDPFSAATWLDRAGIPHPIEICTLYHSEAGAPVGGTPDFSTVYFTYPGTLLPEDASRAPNVSSDAVYGLSDWGFYEYREGELREAGVLPDGSLDPLGAVPAASGHGRTPVGNQVSADGSRAFFVSPDPASCGTSCATAADPPELYVREHGEKTLLVSKDTLLPEVNGLPTAAPNGAAPMPNHFNNGSEFDASYVFASSDGSQAFFQSEDQLTAQAPQGPPGDMSPKTYDFDVNTGSLTYLPGVDAEGILAVSADGSRVLFNSENGLSVWSAGPAGGSVTPIFALGAGRPARASGDGSVFVFMASDWPGFNDAGASEIFRYDVPSSP